MPRDNPRSGRTRNGAPRSDNGRPERSRGEKLSFAMRDTAIGEVGARDVGAGLRLQKEMLGLFSELGQDWFARAAAEAQLALRLPIRLTAARSFPDAVTAYQEWFGEWITQCSEDSQRLFSDGQKIVVAGTRYLTKEQSSLSGRRSLCRLPHRTFETDQTSPAAACLPAEPTCARDVDGAAKRCCRVLRLRQQMTGVAMGFKKIAFEATEIKESRTRHVIKLAALRAALVTVLIGTPAVAHDNGQFGDVPAQVREWFHNVRSAKGIPCCDIADGHRTDFDMRKELYWVPVNGNWVPVPPDAVLKNAGNPTGGAVVWYSIYSGQVIIRCFVPGGGA